MDDLEDFQIDQTKRHISVEAFAPGPKKIIVVSFEGVEELSALSRFRLEVVSMGRALKPSEILGQKLGIALRVRDHVRKFHGIVSRFEVLRTSIRGHYLHLVELSPPAWLLTLNQRFRIFQDSSSPEVIEKVLSDGGLSFELKTVGDVREYWVQYSESDFNFVSRLWEEEGLFYRFDHSTPACKLIVGDGASDYGSPDPEILLAGVNLLSLQPQYRIGSSAFKHAWWDFEQVSLVDANVNGLGKMQPPGLPARQVFEYSGRHQTDGEADRLAKARMEAEESSLVWVVGSSYDCRIETGARCDVEGVSVEMPAGGSTSKFVATRVEHWARDFAQMPFEGDTSYVNEFVCIPSELNYRPPRVTPRPFIQGPQTATVTETPDKYGRAKVRFHWEETNTSRWARVAQNWAYNKMGTQFFPRVDSEVVVEFLNGDPDHPIIVGMVYNGDNMPPFDLPGNKTQSGIRGANWGQSGEADVSNELRFEDLEGSEEIYIHAQKDQRRVVKNDDSLTVQMGNRTIVLEQGDLSQDLKLGNSSYKMDAGWSQTEAMQHITLKVGQSSIRLDQMGVTIKGMMIKIEGQVSVDVQSLMTTVKGDAMLTLKGGVTFIN